MRRSVVPLTRSTPHRSPEAMAADDRFGDGPLQFAYHRGIAPMLWVLIGLSAIELGVVHALLAFWNGWVALVVSLLTASGMIWLIALVRSMPRLPVLLDAERLVLRVGFLRRFDILLGNIAGVRTSWESRVEKAKTVSNLALIAYPNVMIDLRQPIVSGRRTITTVAHRMDDLPGFLVALNHGMQR